ncbi:MAG: hypothetical protein JF623_06400 [Acidobacteria bacterium]|nr:hypothetical protein [Acidobacteriota bacterium]
MIDHDAADELLAGYVLGSLSGPDAEEADRLLTEHVPDCLTCRTTLDAFRGSRGDGGGDPSSGHPLASSRAPPRRSSCSASSGSAC